MLDSNKLGNDIAARLKELRGEDSVSERLSRDIEAKTGVKISKSCLTNYDKRYDSYDSKAGTNLGMSVKNLCALADYYGVSTDYILGRSDCPSPERHDAIACEVTGLSPYSVSRLKHELPGDLLRRLIDFAIATDNDHEDEYGVLRSGGELTELIRLIGYARHLHRSYSEDKERAFRVFEDTDEFDAQNDELKSKYGAEIYLQKDVFDAQVHKAAISAENIIVSFIYYLISDEGGHGNE